MNGLEWARLGAPCHEVLNHQIISFMSQAHERIIANVPRVTKGNKGNGAIYKFWLVYTENFQPISFVILLLSIKYAPSHTSTRTSYQNQYNHRTECASSAALLFLVQTNLTRCYKSKSYGKKTNIYQLPFLNQL